MNFGWFNLSRMKEQIPLTRRCPLTFLSKLIDTCVRDGRYDNDFAVRPLESYAGLCSR
jgi:hypothetical protein